MKQSSLLGRYLIHLLWLALNSFKASWSIFGTKHPQLKALRSEQLHSQPSTVSPFWLALATILRGWAMAQQGQSEEGFAQMRQGLTALEATGAETMAAVLSCSSGRSVWGNGPARTGLIVLAESLAVADKMRSAGGRPSCIDFMAIF